MYNETLRNEIISKLSINGVNKAMSIIEFIHWYEFVFEKDFSIFSLRNIINS